MFNECLAIYFVITYDSKRTAYSKNTHMHKYHTYIKIRHRSCLMITGKSSSLN